MTVSYRTFGGTASVSGGDFEFVQGEVTIDVNRDQATIAVPIFDDTLPENREEFSLVLTGITSSNAEFENTSATITIVDNDVASTTAVPFLSARSIFVNEGSGLANIVLVTDQPVPDDVVVRYRTRVGTALSSTGDYIFLDDTATIRAGNDRVTVRIPILDDTQPENQEVFFLSLTGIVNGNAIIVDEDISITIVDNDQNIVVNGTINEVILGAIYSILFEDK